MARETTRGIEIGTRIHIKGNATRGSDNGTVTWVGTGTSLTYRSDRNGGAYLISDIERVSVITTARRLVARQAKRRSHAK